MGISTAELERVQFSTPVTSWSSGALNIAQPAYQKPSTRSVEDLALDGMLSLMKVRQAHPAWFGASLQAGAGTAHSEEDIAIPDLSDIELEELAE
jgi:hypothetical protein